MQFSPTPRFDHCVPVKVSHVFIVFEWKKPRPLKFYNDSDFHNETPPLKILEKSY